MPKPIPLTPVSECAGLKGAMVFPLAPPLPMIVTNRLSSTPTSRVRKISAVFAELLMPREPMNQMIAMITALMTHQGMFRFHWLTRNWLPNPPIAANSIGPTAP